MASEPSEASVPQSDGATEPQNGSTLQEPEWDVEVKLADLQTDPNNPLFSIKKFEDLGLYVIWLLRL
jgi:ATP-dependent RNA helicase DDX19/DBP5